MKVKVELEVCDAEDAATALMYDNPKVSKQIAHAVQEARRQRNTVVVVSGQEHLPMFLRRQAD